MRRSVKRKIIGIMVVSAVLAAVLFLMEHVFVQPEQAITRESYGDGEKVLEYEVAVEGEPNTQTFQIKVNEQEYTHKEIQEMFREVTEKLDKIILGENQSFDRVERNLNLVTELEEYPVWIQWQLDSYSVMNVYGEIQEENLVEEGTLVEVRGTICYKDEESVYVQYAHVYPMTREGKEKIFYDIGQAVKRAEEESREDSEFLLPKEVNGMKLEWMQKEEGRWYYVLLAGATLCVYLLYREREKNKQQIKMRKDELTRDYPGLISKFTMLLSTGATVRNAWEKIVQNYETQKSQVGTRIAYEEVATTLREIQGGMSESEAYERFGKRCDVALYVKFGTLLSQNLRKGSKGISEILKMEAIQAFEERKNTAKRLGEEAGTRLLIPMLGMLAVVFIIVMIPAFLSMQL